MTGWIAENLAASALTMAVVLLVRAPVARWFGARAALALWLAPLIRLLAPPVRLAAPMPDIFIETTTVAAKAAAPVQAAFPVATALAAIWAAGVIAFLAAHWIAYRRFVRRASATGLLLPLAIGGIPVVATPVVRGPAAAGLIHRLIFVPVGFAAAFLPGEQELALRHELLHHRRGDLWLSAAALVVLALHWFNPLAHVAHRVFRRDLESACDADLLALAAPSERATYAAAIVKCAAGPIPKPLCALTDTDELKGRLKMMTLKHGFAQRTAGGLIAASVAAGGLLLAIPAVAQTTTTTTTKDGKTVVEQRKIIMHGADGKEVQLSPSQMKNLPACGQQKIELSTENHADKNTVERQQIKICAKNNETDAEFADSLEKSIGRIEAEPNMSAASKADMVAKIRAKIAELRAGK